MPKKIRKRYALRKEDLGKKPGLVLLGDEHTQPIVELLKAGKAVEAEEAFHELCLQIYDLLHYESFMLARKLRVKAGLQVEKKPVPAG